MLRAITEWMNGDYAGKTMLVLRLLFFICLHALRRLIRGLVTLSGFERATRREKLCGPFHNERYPRKISYLFRP